MSSTKRSIVTNGVLVIVSVVVALILVEITLRILYPRSMATDPILGYVGVPNTDDWDTRGFRNKQALATATIVVLGDSQTQGNNSTREEAWPQLLGENATTSVYQIAVGGFGPIQEAYLIPQALALDPKLVILAPYLGNDVMDAYNIAYNKEYWKDLRDPAFAPPPAASSSDDLRASIQTGLESNSLEFKIYKIRLWIRNNVRVYELLGNATRDAREKLGLARTMTEKRAKIAEFAEAHPDVSYIYDTNPLIKTQLSGIYRSETVDLSSPRAKEGWRIMKNRYDTIISQLEASGTPLLVVIIPTKEYVYISHMQAKGEALPPQLAHYLSKEQNLMKEMKAYFVAKNVPVISMLDALTAALNNGGVVYGQTIDGHPLPYGNHVIANDVFTRLNKGIPYPKQ